MKKENPYNEIIRLDAADESCTVLTKKGSLYSWGKNDRGQLGTGPGVGVEYVEGERYPLLVENTNNRIVTDYTIGDGTLMYKDNMDNLYKSGMKLCYAPEKINIDKNINVKSFCCGNSFYSFISGKLKLRFNNLIIIFF